MGAKVVAECVRESVCVVGVKCVSLSVALVLPYSLSSVLVCDWSVVWSVEAVTVEFCAFATVNADVV